MYAREHLPFKYTHEQKTYILFSVVHPKNTSSKHTTLLQEVHVAGEGTS